MIFIMKDQKKLLDALNWAVEDLGLKQQEVGEILGLKQSGVSLLLGGKRIVKQVHIKKIAAIMGVDPKELIQKSEEWYGESSLPPPKANGQASEQSNNVTLLDQHKGLLKEFKDQKKALEVNRKLLEIERKNPNVHNEVLVFLDCLEKRMESETEDEAQRKQQGPQEKSSGS